MKLTVTRRFILFLAAGMPLLLSCNLLAPGATPIPTLDFPLPTPVRTISFAPTPRTETPVVPATFAPAQSTDTPVPPTEAPNPISTLPPEPTNTRVLPPAPPATLQPTVPPPPGSLTPDDKNNPASFIYWYFKRVTTERDYKNLWGYLTARFSQSASPGGYRDYVSFWNSVSSLDVNRVSYKGQVKTLKWYSISLTFHFKSGKDVAGVYDYYLAFNKDVDHWQFDLP